MATLRTTAFAFFGFGAPALVLIAILVGTAGSLPRIPGALGNHITSYSMFYTALIMVFGWILYLWDVTRNPRVPKEKRALWSAVLLLGGPWALPFYFWHYVRAGSLPPRAGHAGSPAIRPGR